jgi:hypothetical protein
MLLAVVMPVSRTATSADSPRDEYEVKAVFIYNFAQFVTWPASAFERTDSPLVIGIVGKDPFGAKMEQTVKGKELRGRSFVIKRPKWGAEMKDCHILFVSSSEKDKVGQLADLLKGAPVLVVGDMPNFARRGGIVNFFMKDNKVRFQINADAAKRAKLTIDSRLLSLAEIVTDEKEKG